MSVMAWNEGKNDYNIYSYFVVNTCVILISENGKSRIDKIGILPRNRGMV